MRRRRAEALLKQREDQAAAASEPTSIGSASLRNEKSRPRENVVPPPSLSSTDSSQVSFRPRRLAYAFACTALFNLIFLLVISSPHCLLCDVWTIAVVAVLFAIASVVARGRLYTGKIRLISLSNNAFACSC